MILPMILDGEKKEVMLAEAKSMQNNSVLNICLQRIHMSCLAVRNRESQFAAR